MEIMDRFSILQWNAQGIREKKEEVVEMIDEHKVNVIAVQETKLAEYNVFNLTNYNIIRRDGTFNHTPHGGVALFIHSGTPYNVIDLNTPIQAVAVQVHLHTTVTICNVYWPGSQQLHY